MNTDTFKMGRSEFIVLIAALMSVNALAIDVMLPAFTEIENAFSLTNPNDQQLVIYTYVLGFGMPQIVWGPVTDRLGRKGVLLTALAGYILTGLACMYSGGGFTLLLIMRFIQGVFASGCRVVAVSIVRDRFEGRGMARIMSMVMTVFMIVPILAPTLGQLILYVADWQMIFGSLSLFGAILFVWVWFRLPETLAVSDRRPLNPRASASAYMQVYRSRVTLGYMMASGTIFGSLFAFIGSAEQVFSEVFFRGDDFVLWFAGVALSMSFASFANARLVERLGMRRMSQFALIAFISISTLLLVLLLTFGEHFAIFFPLFALIFACFGMIGSNFNALAMEPLGNIAGTGSAAYGFATTTFSALFGWMIGSQFDGSSIPLITGFAVLGAISFIIVMITERGQLFSSK